MNPRPTPICHLGKILGHNLCKALFLKLNGDTEKHHPLSTSIYNVALFPEEWRRDQNSPFIKEFYHDVPWEDIDLLKAYVNAS